MQNSNKQRKRIKIIGITLAIIVLIISTVFILMKKNTNTILSSYDNELLRTMSYDQFLDGDENIDATENVKFSSFFLRDLDGDGYAEKIKGTCKQIGSQDTLYMEIIVQTEGYLKDAKIEINGQNFWLQTALPKDNELKDNYIGNNVKKIEFEQLNNGTQKLLTGIVNCGDYTHYYSKYDAIGNNINNYSRNDNSIVLTGTYVAENGTETPITKEINLATDWYGTTEATVNVATQNYYDIENRIDEENGKLKLAFDIKTGENKLELNISSNYVETTIPQLNGYNPVSVSLVSGGGEATYDETTRLFTITKNAETDANGIITTSISRNSANKIEVVYPLEAYTSLGKDSVSIKIPVSTYYEGYNNTNPEFHNPYKSNIANATIVANYSKNKGNATYFEITVGKHVSTPELHYMISKRKPLRLYNETSSDEKDDFYTVCWEAHTGSNGELGGLVLKENKNGEMHKKDTFIKNNSSEDSMEEITTNIGIYFTNATSMLGKDGEIRIYNEDTGELVHTFYSNEWSRYTGYSPYRYESSIKHIKVETSKTNADATLYVYNIKELDDNKITETYTREEFENLKYIKSNLTMYIDGNYVGEKTHRAKYEEPYSIANISLSEDILSTQVTKKGLNIEIKTLANELDNQEKWTNGTFLIKIPDEILDVKINEAIVNNLSVNLDSAEIIENASGKFIKVKTSNINPAEYTISINVDVTPDPRISTVSRKVELYAINENGEEYYYSNNDQFDLDEDSNTAEKVNYRTASINLVAPNSMLTNQSLSDFDDIGTIIISPKVAELKPVYGDDDLEKQTVKIGAQLKNNYSNTISEVIMVGRIPFEGNTFVLSGGNLDSEYSTTMKDTGITVSTELQGEVTVYYSENANPSKDLSNASNGWTLKENVSDWSKIKTWAVDFGDTVLNKGDEYTFYYTVEIPFGVELNKVAYSHHGIYFSLDTAEGKYRTQTEPNKVGIRIADKYDLELTKYQKNVNKLIQGATYKVSKLDDRGNIIETQTAKTNDQGQLRMTNLYAENVYEVEEIQTPEDYELNDDVIKFIGHVNRETGELTIEKLAGITKGDILVIKNRNVDYKAQVNVEDEARAKLKIVKYEQGTELKVSETRYIINGERLPNTGKTIKTNVDGEAIIPGIKVGSEYTIKESKEAEGYYLNTDIIKFTINNNNGTYEINISEGSTKATSLTLENDLPVARIEVEDEKIPTYDLVINKIEKGTGIDGVPTVPVVGAKFKLYKGNKEKDTYITDDSGQLLINGLYQYEENKNIEQTYTLKETYAPEGYAKTKDITFKAQVIDSTLTLITDDNLSYTTENNTINLKVEDSKSFKLIKKDGETNALLPNVKFAIYNEDNGGVPARNSKGEIIGNKETIDGKEYYTLTTNSRGEITADLPEGIYRAVEVEAADKYDIEGQEQFFGIGESRVGKKISSIKSASSIGGPQSETIKAINATKDGGYIVGGVFYSQNLEIGNYTLTNTSSSGYNDAFIVKYDSDNEVEWARSFGVGDTKNDSINSIVETEDGNYIVGGQYGDDAILIKYDVNGEIVWEKVFGEQYSEIINSIALTADGGFVVGGSFSSPNVQIGNILLTRMGRDDAFIIKYNNSDEVEWVRSFGGTESDSINSIAVTKNGDYIVGGYFESNSMQVGEYTFTCNGSEDAFIVKYNNRGEVNWASSFGGSKSDKITSISAANDEGYVVAGQFESSSMQVMDNTLVSNGQEDAFLIKYDDSNNLEWIRSFGGNKYEYLDCVLSTKSGSYIVTGCFNSRNMPAGEYSLTNDNNSLYYRSSFIIEYNNTGEVEWATAFGGNGIDTEIYSAAETKNGEYVVGGYFYQNIQIGKYSLENNGGNDALLIKIKSKEIPEVVYEGASSLGSTQEDYLTSIVSTDDGGYLTVGYFSSPRLQIGNYTLINKGDYDAFIVKYDKNGEVEWAKQIEGTGYETINSVEQTVDGGYIVGGSFSSPSMQIGKYTLTSNGDYDAFISKYNNKGEVEWASAFGGEKNDVVKSVRQTADGGYIVGGEFEGSNLQVGEYALTTYQNSNGIVVKYNEIGIVEWVSSFGAPIICHINSAKATADGGCIVGGSFFGYNDMLVGETLLINHGYEDGFLIKYDSNGRAEWAKSIGGGYSDSINSIAVAKDGSYIVGGSFSGSSIQVGNYTLENTSGTNATSTAYITKYDIDGEVKWANIIVEKINYIGTTKDGGAIVGGYVYGKEIQIDDYNLVSNGNQDACIVKYDENGKVEWADTFGGTDVDQIKSIAETESGDYIVGGYFNSLSIQLGEYNITNNGEYDTFLIKIKAYKPANEQEEIIFENQRKDYNITTEVKKLEEIKGGSISGEGKKSYETVKHGDSSTKPIIMTPDDNYEIIGITVNGKEYPYIPLPDDSFQMLQFENMTEDKHVVVTYALKDNKIILNKVDKDTREKLSNVEFKLDQIDERIDPENSEILGNLTENGTACYVPDTNNEVTTTTLGQLTNNGSYYFVNKDGSFVPNNSKTYIEENNLGTTGVQYSTASSYMKIDLTGLSGRYVAVVNARVSSQTSADYGFATITDNTTAPSYNNSNGRFMYISGTIANKDFRYGKLEGGNTYYLHLGYRKNGSNDTDEDQVVINSVKIYKADVERYNFSENNGVYESSNVGNDNTVCNSYIQIDLTNYTGKYNITVNAEISTQFGDYGYVTINGEETAPSYDNTDGRIVYLTGIQAAKDFTFEMDGGYQYYLHLGYYKDEITNIIGDDIFKVNSISLTLNGSELYHTSTTTNSEGKAITQIPFGKYNITEINAPEGYKQLDGPVIIEFRENDGAQHEFTIENEKLAKVIVHHYIKGTNTKLAEDEEYYGAVDEDYTTSPKLDLIGYVLEKDTNEEYILPTNATGKYIAEDTHVTYYYVPMPAQVIVNHYIEGTENPVPLSNGSEALREIKNGNPGNNYTTSAITPENLDQRYELIEVPNNSTGNFTEEEITVNYFYKLKSYKITTEVEEYDQTNILGDIEHIRGGDILGEKENPYETVKHSENSKKDIIVTPEQGYEVQNLTINGDVLPFTAESDGKVELDKFTNVTEDKHVVVRLGKKISSVLVHHYIEGTTTKVPSKYGGEVQDQTTSGPIGNPYITNPTDELTPRYELVEIPTNASGLFGENQTEVIYYYREVPAKVIVNHYIENTTNQVPLNNGGTASQEIINGYVTKPYETNPLTNVSDQYVYVSDSGRTSGEMTKEDIVVNYYYEAKAYAQVNYIERKSDGTETTLETIDYQGLDGEKYTAHSKDFSGYYLIEKPNIETKNLNKDQVTTFNYYYSKETGLLEKHIDLYNDEILFNESHIKNYDDEYEIGSKTFDGYDIATNKKYYEKQIKDNPNILSDNGVDSIEGLLNKLNLEPNDPYIPDNYKGTVGQNPIEVKYYYMKKAKVIVEYRDKLTDEPIHPDTPIDGHEKDPYKTNPEDIDGYDLTEDPDYTPNNTEGEMTPDTITVTYYYDQKAEVEVNHIYIVDESLIENGKIEGHVKDLYKTETLDNTKHPNYRLVTNKEYYDYAVEKDSSILSDNNVTTVGELLAKLKLSEYDPYIPENSKGEMTKEKIIVNYYYKKQAKVIVKYIDEETGKELADPEEEIKDLGDPYSTEPKTIEKYEVAKEKLPENAEGIVDEDGEEVIYYYRKAKKPTANSGKTDEKVSSPQTGDTTLKIAIGMLLGLITLNIIEKTHFNKKGTKPSKFIK